MDGKADVKCVLFFECTEEVCTLTVQSICIFVENVVICCYVVQVCHDYITPYHHIYYM